MNNDAPNRSRRHAMRIGRDSFNENPLFWRVLMLLAGIALVTGCASPSHRQVQHDNLQSRTPALNESLFGEPERVPDFSEMVSLTPEQQADFLSFFHSGADLHDEPHQRVFAYLTRRIGDTAFQNRTLSASEAIETGSGNCMSLALVTTAYARLAGVETGWQLSDTDPVYSSEGSVIYSAEHIQTRLYRPEFDVKSFLVVPGRRYLLVDYYTDDVPRRGTPLSESEMIALVYQNLGIEALADGHLEDSFWHLRTALEYDAANPDLYNAMAVVHKRAGDARTAERLYRFALDQFGDRLIVLRNYRQLLLAEDRIEDADHVERRIMALPDPDPYPLLGLGDDAAEKGRHDVALGYYRRAAGIAPYLPEVYLKIAIIHIRTGNLKRAERALQTAREHARSDNDQKRYEAKIMALRG